MEELAPGAQELNDLKAGGFSAPEIEAYQQEQIKTLGDAGFSTEEIKAHYGQATPDMSATKGYLETNLKAHAERSAAAPPITGEVQGPPEVFGPNEPVTKNAQGFLEAVDAGFQMSVSGLIKRQKNPELVLPENAEMFMRIASQVGTLAGDLPAMVAGSIAGGAAGSPVGPLGVAAGGNAGAFVLPATMRKILMDHYSKGDIQDFGEFWTRAGGTFLEALKAGTIGTATGVVGKLGGLALEAGTPIASGLTKAISVGAAEVGTMVTVGKLIEGEIPKASDFAEAALLVGGLHAATSVGGKLRSMYAETGAKPADIALQAQTDPAIRQKLLEKDQGPVEPGRAGAPEGPQHSTPSEPPQILKYDPAPDLKPFQREAETRLAETLSKPDAAEKYAAIPESMGGKVLDTDIARKLSPDYSESVDSASAHTASTNRPASAWVQEQYFKRLEATPEGPVLLMAGGGGSGKTTVRNSFLESQLREAEVVVDGSLSDPQKAFKTIDAALESGRPVNIGFVYRPLDAAADLVTKRFGKEGRHVLPEILTSAHVGAIDTILKVAKRYQGREVTIHAFDNSGKSPKPIALEQLAAKRYNAEGETNAQAAARLLPSVQEKLSDVQSRAEKAIEAAHNRRNEGKKPPSGGGSDGGGDAGPDQGGGGSSGGAGGQGGSGTGEGPTGKSGGQETSGILSRIGTPEQRKADLSFDKFYTAAIDDLHPLKRFVDTLAPDGLPAKEDPYVLARLNRGAFGKADQFLEHSPFKFDSLENVGKSFKDVMEPVKDNLDGFREYAISKRAIELESRGIKTGVPIEEAKLAVEKGKAQFEKTFGELQDYQNRVLEYLRDSGVISKDGFAAMKEANKDYVPFHRLMEDGETKTPGGRKLTVKNPVKAIVGSERLLTDPIESIIKNTYSFITIAERNRVMTALVDLAEGAAKGSDFLQKSDKPIVDTKALESFLKGMGVEGDSKGLLGLGSDKTIGKDQISVFKDGERQVYNVSADLGQAIKGLDKESVHWFVKMLAVPAKSLRAATGIVPDFILRNVFRDQVTAFNQSKEGLSFRLWDTLKGVGSILKEDTDYQNWLKSGGGNSALVAIDRQYIQNNIYKLSQETGLMNRVQNLVKAPLEMLRVSSELMENATRVGEFKRVAQGETDPNTILKAGFDSREVTLDFARIGAKMRSMNMITAFFNAGIQGLDKVARSFKEDPLGMSAKVATSVTMPTMLLWWANKDDERYKELPRWQKDLFWIVPTDSWQKAQGSEFASYPSHLRRQAADGSQEVNKGVIYRLPKPFDVGVIFGSIPERTMEAYLQHNPKAFQGLSDSIIQAFTPSFLPTFATPLIEHFANKSTFTGKSIVPTAMEGLLPEYQYTEYTSDTAKLLGKFVASLPGKDARFNTFASPAVLENYARAWSGNLGKYALDLADKALEKAGIAPEPVRPASTLADMPFVKAFVIRYPSESAQSIQDFFDRFKKSEIVMKTIQHLSKSGDVEAAQKELLLEDNKPYLIQLGGIKDSLSNQMKFMRMIDRNPDIKPEEKRQLVDGIYYGMIEQVKIGNKIFDDADTLLATKPEKAKK